MGIQVYANQGVSPFWGPVRSQNREILGIL